MNTTTIENAADVGVNLAHLSKEISKARVLVEDAIEDSKHKAERLVKRATVTTQECVEDTTYYIKRHPWQAVGVATCVGAAMGLLLSFVISPSCNRAKTN